MQGRGIIHAEEGSPGGGPVSNCHDVLSLVLSFTAQESEFLERLNSRGDIAPDLITTDERLQHVIREHPGLLWKALNVRRHREGGGLAALPASEA